MRMSCNGCRVLRKGCSEDCSIRPCLQWIKTPESQAHATLFLAKFYGRAGLLNLVNAGPSHLRPAIFRSLFYEACGRIVNPIYGSVGLLWSGNWTLCQNAVDAVLKGSPITPISPDDDASGSPPQQIVNGIKDGCNIRHVIKDTQVMSTSNSSGNDVCKGSVAVHRVRNRTKFKKSGVKPCVNKYPDDKKLVTKKESGGVDAAVVRVMEEDEPVQGGSAVSWMNRSLSPSRDSSVSHGAGETNESMVSVEMTEATATPAGCPVIKPVAKRVERRSNGVGEGGGCSSVPELDLRLGLGFGFESSSNGGDAPQPRKSSSNSLNDRLSDKSSTGFVIELGLS